MKRWLNTIKGLFNAAANPLENQLVANVQIGDPGADGKVMIAPFGEYPHRAGMQVLDRAALERVMNQLAALGRDVVIDWGHESFTNPKAEAAGWIKHGTCELRNDGLYAQVDWTAEAKAGIEAKKFRFLSPVFQPDPSKSKDGRLYITGLINAAVVNNPNIPAMKPLVNQISEENEAMKELLAKLANALGLKDSGEEAIINAITALKTTSEGTALLANRLAAVEAAFPAMKGLEGEQLANALLMAVKPPAASDDEVAALKNRLAVLEGKDIEAVVANAITAGKITPAQKDWALNLAAHNRPLFDQYLANAVSFTGATVLKAGEKPAAGFSPEALAVFNQLGLDEKGALKNVTETGKEK